MRTPPTIEMTIRPTGERIVIRSFSSGSVFHDIEHVKTDADLLRETAEWLEAVPGRVLIGVHSVGFGEPDEIVLQVTATELIP